jgi:septal ring factor EnvC (AmiA/AmiB activator)
MTNEVKQIKAEMDSLRSSLKDKADENADLLRRIKSMTDEIVSI